MAPVHDFEVLDALGFGNVFFQSHVEEHDAGADAVSHLIDGSPARSDFQGIGLAVLAVSLVFPAIDSVVGSKDDDGFLQFFRMQRPLDAGDTAGQIGQLAVLTNRQAGQALVALSRLRQIHRFDGTDNLF